jgi:hypothetical protein
MRISIAQMLRAFRHLRCDPHPNPRPAGEGVKLRAHRHALSRERDLLRQRAANCTAAN